MVCWLYAGRVELLSPAARDAIEREALAVSPMVGLELQYLREIGRIRHGPKRIMAALRADRVSLVALQYLELLAADQENLVRLPAVCTVGESMTPRIGFCKTCERQTSEDTLVCPHCGQAAPFDRYEDLELGRSYPAEYKGMATEDVHWFKLKSSGRRVFAMIAGADKAGGTVREANARNGEHVLELVSFEGGFPNFRYKQKEPNA